MAYGNVFAGTPDQFYVQIKNFWEYSGGFGHMLIMGQAGFLSDQEALKSMRLFAREVYPRLKELNTSIRPEELWERSKESPVRKELDPGLLGVEFSR